MLLFYQQLAWLPSRRKASSPKCDLTVQLDSCRPVVQNRQHGSVCQRRLKRGSLAICSTPARCTFVATGQNYSNPCIPRISDREKNLRECWLRRVRRWPRQPCRPPKSSFPRRKSPPGPTAELGIAAAVPVPGVVPRRQVRHLGPLERPVRARARRLVRPQMYLPTKSTENARQAGADYAYHVAHYGHPSKFGFKDICNLWKAEKWGRRS